MALLPAPLIPNANEGFNAYRQGYAVGQDRRRNALLSEAGQIASGGDMKGARNALLAGGAFDEGMRLQSHLDAQAQRARGNRMEDMRMQWAQEDRKQALDERQLAKAQRLNGAFGRLALSVKNLPETERGAAWAQVVEQGRRLGADVAGFEDVSAIDRAIAQSMEMDEYLKYVQGGSKSGLMEVSPGATVYDPRNGKGVFTAPVATKPPASLDAASRKEVFEADEAAEAATNVMGALDKAISLNNEAYSGPAAQTRGYLTSLYGADGGTATEELQNVILGQVLDNLKATFGAAPTEGERQILMDLQGSVNKSTKSRKRIFDRARTAAEKRLRFNQERAGALRGGEYFQPGYDPVAASRGDVRAVRPTEGAESPSGPAQVATKQEYDALPPGTQYVAPDGSIRTKK